MRKYEKYKDSGSKWIGIIPKNWKIRKISGIYSERNEKVSDKDYPPLSVTMRGILPQLENVAKTNNGDDRKLVLCNDFVINSRADRRGACGISSYNGSVSLINTVLNPLKKTNNLYFSFVLCSANFSDEFFRWGNGIHNDLWSTKWSKMKNIVVPIPSPKEQDSIAKFLDNRISSIDKLINDKQNLIEKLKEYRQAIINETVTKGLDKNVSMKDSGVEWIGEIPEGWDIKRLKNMGIFRRGSGIKKDDVNNEGIPCIRYGEIYTKYNHSFRETTSFVSEDIAKNCLQVSIDDILITLTGETKEDIGKAIVYLDDGRLVAGGDLAVLKCTDSNSSYVTYFLNAEISKLQKENLAVGEIIAHIGIANLQKIIIPLPDKNLQDKIVLSLDKKTSRIESTINNITMQISNLQEYKKSIISEAVTGKIKVD